MCNQQTVSVMKIVLMIIVAAAWQLSQAVTPQIKNVKAMRQYPWDSNIYISYEVVGDIVAAAGSGEQPFLVVVAKDDGTGRTYETTHLSGDTGVEEGIHKIVWNIEADGVSIDSGSATFTVMYCNELYMVVDLSAGADATTYPISYLGYIGNASQDGWTDEYKTSKLLLRRIEPGSFKMSGLYDVMLTKPYYIGVFEVTQRQYELVMGSNPSHLTNVLYYATRPVGWVSYDMIRGSSNGADWPGSSAVDASSFMGRLRARTGIDKFDLPTEAQWEYACRAGTTTDYNSGKNNTGLHECANMDEVGRYLYNGGNDINNNYNCSVDAGTAKVGSYLPNAWGLYDMHGNVEEWCLDWYSSLSDDLSGVTDPAGPSSASKHRVCRGGSFAGSAIYCCSSSRVWNKPSDGDGRNGFRLVRTLSN